MVDQQPMPPPMGAPPPMQNPSQNQSPKSPPPMGSPSFPQPPQQQQQQGGNSVEEIEQVVETIIDERWKEVTENIKKVIDWKNAMDEKFTKMDEDVKNLKEDFNELYKAIVSKVGDYDKNILKVDSALKAIKTIFSHVLPTFTANFNALSRVPDDFKSHHKKSKEK